MGPQEKLFFARIGEVMREKTTKELGRYLDEVSPVVLASPICYAVPERNLIRQPETKLTLWSRLSTSVR